MLDHFLLILNCQTRHQNSICKNMLNVFFAPRFNRNLLTATVRLSAIKVNQGEACL